MSHGADGESDFEAFLVSQRTDETARSLRCRALRVARPRLNRRIFGVCLLSAGLFAYWPWRSRAQGALRPSHTLIRPEVLADSGPAVFEQGVPRCSNGTANCLETECCTESGMQCYTKNKWYGRCRQNCISGSRDPKENVDVMPWDCKAVGKRTPGKVRTCSSVGKNCLASQCCADAGSQCYEKNETWAACRVSCTPGPDDQDIDNASWTCHSLGPRAEGRAQWVLSECSSNHEDCTSSRCCKTSGTRCYEKNPYWATCLGTCIPGIDKSEKKKWQTPWSCKPLGFPAPNTKEEVRAKLALAQPLKSPNCSASGENCLYSRCCISQDEQCYEKENLATCRATCAAKTRREVAEAVAEAVAHGVEEETALAIETAEADCALLPRFASLFCFSVMQVNTYEQELMESQLGKRAGIFSCDDFIVLADANISLGAAPKGYPDDTEVRTLTFKKEPVWISRDGTSANTLLFLRVWDAVIENGRFRRHTWTVKVDPDAVLLPETLRQHVFKHSGKTAYVVNCDLYPDSPNFPMMFGPVEAFTLSAVSLYAMVGWRCITGLGWGLWGEDYYMGHCMDYLGVSRILDFNVVGDSNCKGAVCSDGLSAAYHPFKTVSTWMKCYNEAIKNRPPLLETFDGKRPVKEKIADLSTPPPVPSDGRSVQESVHVAENEILKSVPTTQKPLPRPTISYCCNYLPFKGEDCDVCVPYASDNYCAQDSTHCTACGNTWCDV